MKDNELEKTQPILKVKDEGEPKKRSEKYNYLEDDELVNITSEEKEAMEQAEEALAEKNIALAESLLASEKEEKKTESTESEDVTDDEKEEEKEAKKNKKSLKEKWSSLSKKQKILAIVVLVLILLIIIGLVVLLVLKLNKPEKENKEEKAKEEKPVVIVDNFYYKDGSLYILDEAENEIGSYECKNKDSKLCYVAINNYHDTLDVPKVLDENNKEKIERMPVYDNNYIFVYDNKNENDNQIILYSLKDKKKVDTYLNVKAYDDNYVIIENNEKAYGLIKVENGITEVIKPSYNLLLMLDGADNLIGQKNNSYFVIDKSNKVLSKGIPINENIKNVKYYSNSLIVTENNNSYSLYDYEGRLVTGGYDFITVRDNYGFVVNNHNELLVFDKDGTKYNETGIKLLNDKYLTTYVYDENGSLSSTKLSFKIEIKDGEISILTYTKDYKEDKYTNLNINEALINKGLDYYNYFNGKLYFYEDKEKVFLLGSYSCNNKNEVSSPKDNYSNCYPAHDTIYEDNDMVSKADKERKSTAAIFNKRYVFINDGSGTINLYDLVEKKNKGAYSSVNTYTSNNDYKLTHKSGNFDVIALNKKGKYGMIFLGADKVSGKYGFNYNKLEKLGSYVLAENSSNKWQIIYDENTASVLYPSKVRGYTAKDGYVKVKDKTGYSVYGSDGKKISKETYSYVELYDKFYAGVSGDKSLKLYDYEGNELYSEEVTLYSKDYLGDKPSFKVTLKGENHIVSVLKNDKYEDVILEKEVEVDPLPEEGEATEGEESR